MGAAGLGNIDGVDCLSKAAAPMGAYARLTKKSMGKDTTSDHVLKGVEITAEERQNSFTQMMKAALDVAVAMENK